MPRGYQLPGTLKTGKKGRSRWLPKLRGTLPENGDIPYNHNMKLQRGDYISHFESFDFEGNSLNNGLWMRGYLQFLNYYGLGFNASFNFEDYNNTLTRGGPLVKDPKGYYFGLSFETDNRKDIVFVFDVGHENNDLKEKYLNLTGAVEWKPSSQITLSIGPEYTKRNSKRQWVGRFEDLFASATYNSRYVFGDIDQETISANIRLNWTITPKMSLQLFMQPLISVGNYSNFKELARPSSMDYNNYDEIGTVVYYIEDGEYIIDPDKEGPADEFRFENPDFNFKSLRGTLVYRWEILPGSIFYLVWSHDRQNSDNAGDLEFGREFNSLMSAETNDIFLAKFSYWLNL